MREAGASRMAISGRACHGSALLKMDDRVVEFKGEGVIKRARTHLAALGCGSEYRGWMDRRGNGMEEVHSRQG